MRLKHYLQNNDYPYFTALIGLLDRPGLNEMVVPENLFTSLKRIGEKIGINIKRSDTIFDYISRAEGGLVDLYTYASLYFLSTNAKQKEELKQYMKDILSNFNVKEITAFLMQLDRATFGITAHVRHILMSLFGIEIATYNRIHTDIEIIQKEIQKVRDLLNKINAEPKVINALDNFQFLLMSIREDGEGAAMGPATTTGDVATFAKRLTGGVARRRPKKKKDLRRLI